METKRGLIIIVWVLSLPFRVLSIIFEFLNLNNINKDIKKASEVIVEYQSYHLNKVFIDVLKVAEDRRNELHYGVDPIAICRAIKVYMLEGKFQGASTIEQQFVRVVSKRYEYKAFRKLREQMLAISISKRFPKNDIAKAYLCIAYYGTNLSGLTAIEQVCKLESKDINLNNIISLISRLKYPEPIIKSEKWFNKYENRNKYILNRFRLK